ncbi:2-oxoacid:acceptor oxidoreductase family protein [Coprothermobacter platensis]|uniref:2-oxoacid:acceptor oxidoreductase family protein n=1 Tax=Coprothermobacter platensis TaxID=108819 RepID=UPI0003653961|nr:2-oxoacid:acceptor oxidoreductase family protein [Coprothermobacter platensis]
MAMRREVYIVGSGGQGVVLMGALLAEAYALKNWNVVQTVVYDAAQRGGLARAEVVMSDSEIYYPKVRKADVIVAFAADALPGARPKMDEHTVILADESLKDKNLEQYGTKLLFVPFERWAKEELHSSRVMNMVALGRVLKTLGDVSIDEVEQALKERFKGDLFKLNMAAVKIGLEASEF